MALFNNPGPDSRVKEHSGFLKSVQADVIKWEPETKSETEIIVHKFEYEDFPNGSQLIVAPSQMAVFIANMNVGSSMPGGDDGESQVSVFKGPCRIKLETGNSRFAPFRKITNQLTGGESAYHSLVYFIDTTYMNELTWGTRTPILMADPEEGVNIHVRAMGLFGAHVEHDDETLAAVQANKLIREVVGTRADYSRDDFVSFMRAKIWETVPNLLANEMRYKQIGILTVNTKLTEFSQVIYNELKEHFDKFGFTLDNFSFTNINVPDEDLDEVNKSKISRKKKQLEAEGNAMAMDIESEALARKRQREGYTYQQERTYDVFENAAGNEGAAGGTMGVGIGLGMGVGMGGLVGTGFNGMAQNVMANGMPNQMPQPAMAGQMPQPAMGNAMPNQMQQPMGQAGGDGADVKMCPSCNAVMPKNAKFCSQCGHKFNVSTFCINCGAQLPAGARFCLECGTKL